MELGFGRSSPLLILDVSLAVASCIIGNAAHVRQRIDVRVGRSVVTLTLHSIERSAKRSGDFPSSLKRRERQYAVQGMVFRGT